MGITHNWHIDTLIGMFIANFIGGLSLGWWKHNHNIHHVVTNAPEHDPDIEHLPFLAVSHRFFTSLRSTYYDRVMEYTTVAQFMMHYQPYLYYVLLAFGRFNLYVLSGNPLLFGSFPPKLRWHRYFETLGELVFWYWFGYQILYLSITTWSSRLSFLLVSHMVTMPLHVQFSVSHFAMSTADLGPTESFPQKMLRTMMDVDCPPWLDFLHGGLQFQAIHHLFPRLPRYNLRRAQVLVREFCRETGIPYALYGFVESNGKVIGRLGEVSRQAAIFAECQEVIVRDTSVSGNL
jgi:delta8-fatty-acid desaturase